MSEWMSLLYPVEPQVDWAALDRKVLAYWERADIFRRSVESRPLDRSYVFYDGPPFATGLPHYGHIVTGVIKDLVPRFFTMCGYHVPRRLGWDCHGVPAEYAAEQELGISGPEDIERIGMARFNEACRAVVLRYTQEWVKTMTRIGRWVDYGNDYKTMDPSFMESVWWVFKRLWECGLLYQDYKVVHYSWRLATTYSNFEARLDDAYREREDPAVVVPFELDDGAGFLLAWTTTPWTLPSNMALAVSRDTTYCQVRSEEAGRAGHYVVARSLVDKWFPGDEVEIIAQFEGRELEGRTYRPLMPYFSPLKAKGGFKVIATDFVTTEEGTGIVHLAPAFGEDDFQAARAHGIPLVNPVDDSGRFTTEVAEYAGMNVFDANPAIIERLKAEGKLFAQGTVTHSYPHDWRTDTPLIYRAVPSWYVNVTALKDRMLANNAHINWVPSYLKEGAFGNWLANARDWAISRSRYWGTPLPVWECAACGQQTVIGSIAELEERSGETSITDLHRHHIDAIQISCSTCEEPMSRVPEVLDCWFESGSMPYAQAHYPFENVEWFEANYPADFIVEYTGQVRGWFYTLMVLSTALFDRQPFKNVVVHGVTLGEDGRKMSKRLRNYPDPEEIVEEFGADTLRMYLIDHPVIDAKDVRIEREGIVQVYRRFTLPLWNAFSFLVRYAAIDEWRPVERERQSGTTLDRWLRSKAYGLPYGVGDALHRYDLRAAAVLLAGFVDDLTKWYVRRSKGRIWRSEQDEAKAAAYETLYEALVLFSQVAAPFCPFLSEVMYRNLTGRESVHLEDWPAPNRAYIDRELEDKMAVARQIASLGLAARAKAQIKVRQPLALARVHAGRYLEAEYLALIADELNVKSVEWVDDVTAYADPVARPDPGVIGPRYGARTPQILRAARAGHWETLADGRVRIAGTDDWVFDRAVVPTYYESKPGTLCETKDDLVVILDTRVSEALAREGLARDLVRHIQMLRKEVGYPIDERVIVGIQSDDAGVLRCVSEFGPYIRATTLAETLYTEPDQDWTASKELLLHGTAVRIGVRSRESKPGGHKPVTPDGSAEEPR